MTMSSKAPTNSYYPIWIVLPTTTPCVYSEVYSELHLISTIKNQNILVIHLLFNFGLK